MTPAKQISSFLAKYTPAVQKEARAARRTLRRVMPTAVGMVYDNYNALVFGFAPGDRPSEAILSLALFPRWVTLCFIQGARLKDPGGLLRGSGSIVRSVPLAGAGDLAKPAIRSLILQSLDKAKVPLQKGVRGRTVIPLISAKHRPRRPVLR